MLEVSRSGYYEWLGRKPSLRRQQDQALKRRLLSLHQRYPALGLDSLYHLIRSELACSRKRIHRLMNELNISSARKRAYKATTNSRHAHPIAPNLLARQFSFDAPNKAWVGDITYIGNDVAHNTPSAVQQRCYTVDDLRVILNVSRSTVYQLLKRNEFRWFQIGGGKYRISKKSFDDWLDCQS